MPESRKNLGKLVSVHGTSPAFLQRATVVAVVSFFFFLAMLVAFYIRQQIGYFVLSSAFLVVYLFMMVGIWLQKRNVVKIYENGISYKTFTGTWDVISVEFIKNGEGEKPSISLVKDREKILLPSSINDIEKITTLLHSRLGAGASRRQTWKS